jgi:Alpha/beta hydrolase domain
MTDGASGLASATIEGPLTGGRDRPFGMPDGSLLEEHGYVMEEFLVSGTARCYESAAGTEAGADGHWTTRPAATENT